MKICTEIDKTYLCKKRVPLNLPAGANKEGGKMQFQVQPKREILLNNSI